MACLTNRRPSRASRRPSRSPKCAVLACAGIALLLLSNAFATPVHGQASPSVVTWDQRLAVASGGGYRGPWRMNESNFNFVDDPTAAIGDDGATVVAWVDQARQDIFLQIYGPDGETRLDRPTRVSRSPQIFSWLPRMVVSDDIQSVFILWQEIVFSGGSHGGEIFFARSTNGGKSFSSAINLSNTMAGAGKGRITEDRWDNGSLDLARGRPDNLYAAWTEYQGPLRFSRSTNNGASFSAPVHLAGSDAEPARGPSLAVDQRDGTVYLAWTARGDGAADIHFARSTDQGRSFSDPRAVLPSDGYSDAPKIAVDSDGTIHLVYAESVGGPFQRYHVRYARSRDGGRTFAPSRVISGPHAERFESVSFPHLNLDGEDNLYVIWELFANLGSYPRGLGFTSSTDGGDSFAAPSVVPGTLDPEHGVSGSQQGLLMSKLAVNAAGSLAVVNSTFKRGEASYIWLIRGRTTGR